MNRILIIALVVIAVLLLVFAVLVKKGVVLNDVRRSIVSIPQKTELTDDGLLIITPLQEKKAVILKNVRLCTPSNSASLPRYAFKVNTDCSTYRECVTMLDFGSDEIPDSVRLWVEKGHSCQNLIADKLPQRVHPVSYTASVTISAAAKKKLDISEEGSTRVQKTANSRFDSYGALLMGADTKVFITYLSTKPTDSDEFKLGPALIRIKFSDPNE